jgi:hypothetical protein
MKGRLPCGIALAAFLLVAATAPDNSQRRLNPHEVLELPVVAAGGGTSGLSTIETRLLKGNPMKPGLYTISIKVPPGTHIAAHTHRDDRTAVVVAGVWHFGYGPVANEASARPLIPISPGPGQKARPSTSRAKGRPTPIMSKRQIILHTPKKDRRKFA